MPSSINGLEEAIRKLDSIGNATVFKRPMTQATAHLHNKMAKAPRKAHGAFSFYATPAQKRAYWARVSADEITHVEGVGYRRSGSAKSWTTKVSADGRRGEVGIAGVPYAEYVWGERQQPFHKVSGWPRIDKVLQVEERAIVRFFEAEYARQLAK